MVVEYLDRESIRIYCVYSERKCQGQPDAIKDGSMDGNDEDIEDSDTKAEVHSHNVDDIASEEDASEKVSEYVEQLDILTENAEATEEKSGGIEESTDVRNA
jgi:hypothetical protein